MEAIPFNVPGLPEPDELSSEFVLQPITVDSTDFSEGPRLALPAGSARASTPPSSTDGVLCIYPEVETIAYLFDSALQARQRDPLPAIVVSTHSTDGICTIFAFSQDAHDNPLLIVNILPSEYLPKILSPLGGSSLIDLTGIDDRLEITQTFAANSFGIVSRISNELTKQPAEVGNTIFELYDDPASIADVCSFYMSRTLVLSDLESGTGTDALAAPDIPDPVYRLLWRAASARCIAGFATVFILTRLSVSVRRARGETIYAVDYNRSANRRERRDSNAN